MICIFIPNVLLAKSNFFSHLLALPDVHLNISFIGRGCMATTADLEQDLRENCLTSDADLNTAPHDTIS